LRPVARPPNPCQIRRTARVPGAPVTPYHRPHQRKDADHMRGFTPSPRTMRAGLATIVAPAAVAAALLMPSGAPAAAWELAQAPAPKPEMMENCPGLVASQRPRIIPAALRLALASDQVRFTYVGHSTFLLESPQLVRIATDYNDYVRSPVLPDIVTM